MKKTFRYFLIAIAVISVFSGISVTETNAQRINKVLKRMEKRLKSLKTLSANVKMVKYNSQLGESDIIEGQCFFNAGKSTKDFQIRVDWIYPLKESMSLTEDEYVLYRPHINQMIIGKFQKSRTDSKIAENSSPLPKGNPREIKGNLMTQDIFSFMKMSKAQLKENYSFKILGEKVKLENGVKTTHLELISKSETIYKSAEIWVSKKGLPMQVKVTEKNNDSTTVLLKELKRNKKINLKIFTITYPKSVKILKG